MAEIERSLISFLKDLKGKAASLVINGDLFDFWFEWKTVIPRSSFKVLAALSELRESGTEILWIAGNHDCWGGEMLREDIGVDYRMESWRGDIAGWNTLVEHGDGLREIEDRGYRFIRPIMRNKLAMKIFRTLPADFATSIATGSSHASRTYSDVDDGKGLRKIGFDYLAAHKDVDLLIYGHSHVAALEKAPSNNIFANAGSWLNKATYLLITPDKIEMREWRGGGGGSAEGDLIHSVDRSA